MSVEAHLRRIAGIIGATVALFALLALTGTLTSFDALRELRPTGGTMRLNTGLALALAGGALWLLHANRFPRAGLLAAFGATAIAVVDVVGSLAGLSTGLHPVFARFLGVKVGPAVSQMSLHTAIIMTLLGLALIGLRGRPRARKWPVSVWLGNLVVAASAAGLVGLALGDRPDAPRPIAFGLHAGMGLFLLGAGTLLARPEESHLNTLCNPTTAGIFARRIFAGVALMPLLLAMAFVALVDREALRLSDAVVLLPIALVLAGFSVALFSIETAVGIHESREEAEQARLLLTAQLQEQAARLQETVAQRTQELREANASLRAAAESNALLALVAQHSTNGVVITDAAGRIEWVNAAWVELTGHDLAEIKGRKPGHFLQGPETSAAAVAQLRAAVDRGEPCRVEVLNYAKTGRTFWQIIDLQPVRDRTGRVINFVSNHTNSTRQREDQLRLQQLNQRFELAARAAELGVWEWDAVTQRSVWDARTLEIYGVSAEQFSGTLDEWTRRLHPLDRAVATAQVQAALASASHYELEFRILRASDGAERHIQSRAIVQRDGLGRVLRVTGTERDTTAENEARQRMETLNERLRLALRSSNYGVWEFDVLTGRRNWDERVLEIFGLTPAEFDPAQPTWLDMIHPEDLPAFKENFRRVVSGQQPEYAIDFRVVRRDGTTRHISAHAHLQRDSRGKPLRLVGLSRDVTEEKQMAHDLDLAEQRWQLAIEGTDDAVWDWDIVTGEVYHDERWPRMLGYEPGELERSNRQWEALVHPEDKPGNETAIREHFMGRTPFYRHELRMRAKNNTWRWILDRGKVVRRAPDGRPLRMTGTHTDVTDRRVLEERLRNTEALANEVSRLAQIGGWEIDLITSRVTWNEGARRIHDVAETFQPTLESMWQFFPADSLITVQAALAHATPAAPSFDLEVQLLTARGRRLWVRILGHGEFRQGKAIAVRGAIQDVTAQRESSDARRQLEAQLFQAQKMETLGTLAGGIAHDFNNLLTGIIGYHELAADSLPEDHAARACLVEARNASLRARELVEQILTFGRQSAGGDHGVIDLSLVIEEARRFLRATLPANIMIETACAPNCGLVNADATQIHQVVLNLGSNAAHAMRHHGGVLRIMLAPAEVTPDLAVSLGGPTAGSYVRLSVSDTGHGMDESTRRRIFDPFFTTKNTREGTGLGLAVVHGIVRSHRGTIDVESEPGSGSTFHIFLPAAGEANAERGQSPESAPRGGGEFICVVDDEEVVGSCTKLVLESKGYRAVIFGSAEQCLAHLASDTGQCAVLLTDQTMPGMQGTELAAALRKLSPQLPVVIMSGYFSKISPQALDELGQVELLAKPFTTDELAHAVHRALHAPARGIQAGAAP